jgi:uncharacterized protein YeaO (DUF488 family)
MIRLKRVYAPVAPDDGQRFLVDRVWPRGRRKDEVHVVAWLKDAGPSPELRTWFAHDPTRWEGFQRRYRQELEQRPEVLAPLLEAARSGDVTLVYSARDEQHNQAIVLKQVLEDCLR